MLCFKAPARIHVSLRIRLSWNGRFLFFMRNHTLNLFFETHTTLTPSSPLHTHTHTPAEFKSFVMNNNAFSNKYSVIHQRVFTTFWDVLTQIIEAIHHSVNSTIVYTYLKGTISGLKFQTLHFFPNPHFFAHSERNSL